MHNPKRNLKNGSRAFQLVKQLEKVATACLQSNLQDRKRVISRLEELEIIFKPYHDELQKIQEEKKQHELKNKRICAKQGHTGEWKEETNYCKEWMGDLSDKQLVEQQRVRWTRTCTRCGEQEVSETEPEEVRKLRKIKEIEAIEEQVKRMKAEL